MSHRSLALLGAAAAIAVAPLRIMAQAPSRAAKPTIASNGAKAAKVWVAPRTADGKPDLQGTWSNASLTPFERPKEFAGKEFFSQEEAAEFTDGAGSVESGPSRSNPGSGRGRLVQ